MPLASGDAAIRHLSRSSGSRGSQSRGLRDVRIPSGLMYAWQRSQLRYSSVHSFHGLQALGEWQANVVLRERSGSHPGADDVFELRALQPLLERVIRKAVEHRSHPPGEVLRSPHSLETRLRIRVA